MQMRRKDFISSGLGLFAASALSGCMTSEAQKDDALFGRRGKYERVNLVYRRIRLGLKRPFSILHISDTHLAAAYDTEDEEIRRRSAMRNEAFGGHQEKSLKATLAWGIDNVDFVLHTGDLIDFPSKANFDIVRSNFPAMALSAVGNHEYGWPDTPFKKKISEEEFRNACSAPVKEAYPSDISFTSKTVNGVNFVTMDDAFGTVTSEQADRFAKEIARGQPVVLCMHVPFYTEELWTASNKFWRGRGKKFAALKVSKPSGDYLRQLSDPVTRDFIAYLKSQSLLKAVLAGHVHFSSEERFSPTAMQYTVGGNFFYHGQEIVFT